MIQKCENCQTPFQWPQIFRSLLLAFKPINCRQCGAEHKISNASRLMAMLLLLVPAIVASIYLTGFSVLYLLTAVLGLIIIEAVFLPFVLKFNQT